MTEEFENLANVDRAFPSTYKSLNDGHQIHHFGMNLRDYFAAKAMEGSMTIFLSPTNSEIVQIAKTSYSVADAMLEARK